MTPHHASTSFPSSLFLCPPVPCSQYPLPSLLLFLLLHSPLTKPRVLRACHPHSHPEGPLKLQTQMPIHPGTLRVNIFPTEFIIFPQTPVSGAAPQSLQLPKPEPLTLPPHRTPHNHVPSDTMSSQRDFLSRESDLQTVFMVIAFVLKPCHLWGQISVKPYRLL